MNSRPLAPFQSSACSTFTATTTTLYPPSLPGQAPDAPYLLKIATALRCQSGEFCAQPLA
jgi:hypothetical protein